MKVSLSTETDEDDKDKPLKRGRGSQKKTKVLVMAESLPVEGGGSTKEDKPRKAGHLKMFVIDDLKAPAIDSKVSTNVDKETIMDSDNSTSYTNLNKLVKEHRPQVIPKEEVSKMLPWVHIAISNAKRMLLDVFHDIRPVYLRKSMINFLFVNIEFKISLEKGSR
jgi:hypothetical protein